MPRIHAGLRTRILLVALAVVSVIALYKTRVAQKMSDFDVYRTAAARAIAGQPLYRPEDGHYQFKYLPAFAILAAPAALVSDRIAKAGWFAISALLMIVLLALSVGALPAVHRPPPMLVVLTFIAMAKFYAHELVLGQVNLLFAVLIALALVHMRRGRDPLAGGLLALGVLVKPYAIVFLPWAATRRSRLACATMTAGVLVLLALPAVRYGVPGDVRLHADWWRTVTATTAPNVTNADNVSLAALFTRWTGSDATAAPLAAFLSAVLLLICAVVILARRTVPAAGAPDTLEASLLLLLIPILSPQGWDYVLLIATPAIMLLINDLASVPRGLRIAAGIAIGVVAFSIFDLM
ncbi:MAG: glycosyltransferase family 87 protein [Vicinamibacterales bacterium]